MPMVLMTGAVFYPSNRFATGITLMTRFTSTIAVVTGGSRGIGYMIAQGLLEFGCARVYISSRKAAQIPADDVLDPIAAKLSLFLREPQFHSGRQPLRQQLQRRPQGSR